MSIDMRKKDVAWNVVDGTGRVVSWEAVNAAVLMDVRDELKRLNALLYCVNFTRIPHKLDAIVRNTTKKRARKDRGGK